MGTAKQRILVNTESDEATGHSCSIKENMIPFPFIQSRFQNIPAKIYRIDDAKIFEYQVMG